MLQEQFSCYSIDNYEATYVSLSKYNYANDGHVMFFSLQVCHILEVAIKYESTVVRIPRVVRYIIDTL